ncbi:MAG: sugar transferase [Flavobacterium sp.]|nr:sugar transferase [Flavobacterium sp.]
MTKRIFDIFVSLFAILILSWLIVFFWILAAFSTQSGGIFMQKRVGQGGRLFWIFKLRTIKKQTNEIDRLGDFLRRNKIDELPQLFNVLIGNMSMVGPRPDIPGYYDLLKGNDRKILDLKPGITGPASLKYANEEQILAHQQHPLRYNDEVIFPDKIRINIQYQQKQSFWLDIKIIIYTIFGKKLDTYF